MKSIDISNQNNLMIGMDFAKPNGDKTALYKCSLDHNGKLIRTSVVIGEDEIKPLINIDFHISKDGWIGVIEDAEFEIIEPKQLPDARE